MKNILYDHWKIIFGVLLTVSLAGGLTWFKELKDLVIQYNAWIAWTLTLIILAVLTIRGFLKKKKSVNVQVVHSKANYRHEEYKPYIHHGVKWVFWRGNNVPGSFGHTLGDTPLKSYVDGPFCATGNCMYELDERGKKWICGNGHKAIVIPKNLRDNPERIMTKKFDAELRTKKDLNEN